MTDFLVETYAPGLGEGRLVRVADELRVACEALSSAGHEVRHVRSYVVPADEMAFHLFEAVSVETTREAARLAGIEVERIVEAPGVGGRCEEAGRELDPPPTREEGE